MDNSDSDSDTSYHEEEDFINEADEALHSDAEDSDVSPQSLQPQFHSKKSTSQMTIPTTSTKVKPKTRGVKGHKKTFGLPLDRQSFQTFIHEEATVNDEGYPLLPNGDTVYVKQEDQNDPTNWGTFAFTYTTSGDGKDKEKRKPNNWRTVRFTCLGVVVCDNLQCDHLGSPPTSLQKRKDFVSQ